VFATYHHIGDVLTLDCAWVLEEAFSRIIIYNTKMRFFFIYLLFLVRLEVILLLPLVSLTILEVPTLVPGMPK